MSLSVADGESAVRMLRDRPIDCLIVNPAAPALAPSALAEQLAHRPTASRLPVIVYAEGETSEGEACNWRMFRDVLPVRRVHSPERLLDQAAFFLHQDLGKLPESQRRMLVGLHNSDKVLNGKRRAHCR